jgi:hypothetical protein
MALLDLNLSVDGTALPLDVRAFLHEANRRIEQVRLDCRLPGFVPSDFARVYGALRALAAGDLLPGSLFCEWGSGFGVVACLAAMLEFDACGIEIEEELVDAARQLADDFGLSVEFIAVASSPRGAKRASIRAAHLPGSPLTGTGDRRNWGSARQTLMSFLPIPGRTKSG